MDCDWCVFAEHAGFDEWADTEDHSGWVAAGV